MFLYSIDGLNDAVKSTEQYQRIKQATYRKLLIDKCNFVVHSIVTGNRHNWYLNDFEPVPLNSTILKSQLGNNTEANGQKTYLYILDLLQELNIISSDPSYLTTEQADKLNKILETKQYFATSKKYALTTTAKSQGIIQAGVLCKATEKKLDKYRTAQIRRYLKDPIHTRIIHNLIELMFDSNKALPVLDKITEPEQLKHYRTSYETLTRLNKAVTVQDYIKEQAFYYNEGKKVNRVFHYYTNIPKAFRECLYHEDGSKLVEVDLTSAQPLFLGLSYLKNRNNFQNDAPQGYNYTYGREKEIREGRGEVRGICGITSPINDLLSGNFYKKIADYSRIRGDLKTFEMFRNDYGQFKAKVLGNGLYCKLLPLPMNQLMTELYPGFMQWIKELKIRNGYKSVIRMAQNVESNIFVQRFFKGIGDLYAVPIHDSILCKEQDALRVRNRLVDCFLDEFEGVSLDQETVRGLFKIA